MPTLQKKTSLKKVEQPDMKLNRTESYKSTNNRQSFKSNRTNMTFFRDFQKDPISSESPVKKPSTKLRGILDQQGAFENEMITPIGYMNPLYVEPDGYPQPS